MSSIDKLAAQQRLDDELRAAWSDNKTGIKAIETVYKGIRFRSRLEARWAAMFDLLDWRWEYEPVDLLGYIPDFVLRFPAGPVLVEVKPLFDANEMLHDRENTIIRKIDQSGWETENHNSALIVGATWNPSGACGNWHPTAGALRQRYEVSTNGKSWIEQEIWVQELGRNGYRAEQWWWEEGLWFRCHNCHAISIFHFMGGWFCTSCARGGDGRLHGSGDNLGAVSTWVLKDKWYRAGNTVRWQPQR